MLQEVKAGPPISQLTKETRKPKQDEAELDSSGRHLARPRAGRPVNMGKLSTTTKAHQEQEVGES